MGGVCGWACADLLATLDRSLLVFHQLQFYSFTIAIIIILSFDHCHGFNALRYGVRYFMGSIKKNRFAKLSIQC